jgi:uncharacterized repeat protein (TIGR01451 family)
MTGSLKSRKLPRRLPASLRFGALFVAAGISVLASSGPPASDEFNSTVLNSSLWAFTNPAGGSFTLNGTNLLLSAPGGATHDPTATGSDNAVRMMQAIGNVDFDVIVKFDSIPAAQYTNEGIIVEQDGSNFLRFELYSAGTQTYLYAAAIVAGAETAQINNPVAAGGASFWLRVKRVGNIWTESWSTNGVGYTVGVTFTKALTAARIGPFAANYFNPASSTPAFAASIDYFRNIGPDLTVTKTHTGNFTQSGTGSYSITVNNVGSATTTGAVTMTDTVPAGLTATALSGTGWTCALTPTVNCTRSDALAASASYPSITLAVSVAPNAPATVNNSVTVAGGGETNTTNDTATDPTTINAAGVPDLTITKTHSGNFTQGGTGSYTITVNNAGSAATTGTVTMTDTVPTGLTATALSGTGWTCVLTPTVNCTRSDALAASASYPSITLAVSVANNAPATVTNTAAVAGGGETNTANDTATNPTTVNGLPVLKLTKTHTGNFTQGGTGSYTITAGNIGTAATTGLVTMTDTVPTGLTATALSGIGWTCALTPTVNCTRSDALAVNANYPAITLSVSVVNNAPSSVTNSAVLSGGGATANSTATDPTTINAAGVPDLTITKTHSGNFTQASIGSYTITVNNVGAAATTGTVTMTDTVPAGLTATALSGTGWTCALTPTVNCTRGDALAASASYPSITLAVSVANNAPATVTNTVTVAGGGETNTANDTATDPTTVNTAAVPDLTITKTHTGSFTQGGTGSYTITVNNVGAAATTGTVTMTDTVPTGLTATALSGTGWICALTPTVNCTRSDALAASASYPSITLAVSVANNAPATVTNTAAVAGGGETNTANDTATDPTTVNGLPVLKLTKTHTGNFTQGGTGSYTITAGNIGTAATTGLVTMTDTVPTGLTATALSGIGWTCALTPTVNCTRSDALAVNANYPAITLSVSVVNNAPSSVTNSAVLSGGGATANSTATDPTTVNAAGVPDLTVTKTHSGNFTQASTGSYTITVNNAGAAATTGSVTMTDTVPTGLTATAMSGTGWTCALSPTVNCTRSDALAASASYPSITLAVSVANNAPATVTNTAAVAGGGETNTANDTATDPTTVNTAAVPDLTITKTHTGSFTQGGTGSYTITVNNVGAAATTGTVTMTDTVPAGLTATALSGTGWTCALSPTVNCTRSDALAASASYPSITLAVSIANNAPATVNNSVTVAGGGETNTANDTATDPTTVNTGVPDLTVTKTHSGNFTQGGTGSYTITVNNAGAAATTGSVTMTDTVPTGLTATAMSGTGWICALTPTVNCTRSDALAASASYPSITLAVSVANNAPATVTNTAAVAGGGETNTANDTVTDPTTVNTAAVPDLTITKTHTGSFTQGGTGSYTITVNNAGAAATTGSVTMTDTVPAGLTATALSGTGWTCALTPTVNCTRSDALAASASYPSITLAVSVANNASASLTNTATVAGGGETNTANDTATDPTTITASSGPVSDDFHAATLNTGLWTFVNPVGDGTMSLNGTQLLLTTPAGPTHDAYLGGNTTVRVVQATPNIDFQVEAKFDSLGTVAYQDEGILVEQDASNFIRFDVYYDGTATRVFSASIAGSNATNYVNSAVTPGVPIWLRLRRTGNSWTGTWSIDGTTFNTAVTFTATLNVARVGPFAGNCCASSSPAFTAAIDHFFNTASPIVPEDGGPPTISGVTASASFTSATISWTTNRATTSQVSYGLTSTYGTTTPLAATMVTGHTVSVTGLTCGTLYHYKVTSANLGGANSGSSPDATFTTTSCQTLGAPVSDNFDSTSLNTTLWTFVNPLQDGTVTLNGTNALLAIPAGQNHDVWTGANNAPRIMQSIANVDFEVEVKFRSVVSSQYQDQGLIVQQDSQTYLRFDILQADCQTIVFAASFAGGNPTVQLNSRIRNGPNNYMRVKRSGNTWTFSYSYDGQRWTPAVTFNYTLITNQIGPYVANSGPNGNPAPAFTASIDYFANRAAPPATEDGQPFVTSTAPPVISIWYGDSQTFGQNGQPQQWVNILGNVSSASGIKTLTYSLNSGAPQNLWVGENQFRLAAPGDFNVEIDYASLNPGSNSVAITAVDNLNNQTTHIVTLSYVAGQTWPLPYTINWSSVSNIQTVAQIADGMWQIQLDGTLRNTQTGYDRLITLGDRNSWHDYEVTLEATLNALDCHDFGAPAIVVGWQGHTTLQYGVPLPDQPRTGHPFPGLGWYSMDAAPFARLDIFENTPSTPENVMIQDTSGFTLSLGVKYMFKFRVQHNTIGGSHYKYKVWPSGTSEPATYNLEVDGELSQGSIVLGAHRADVSFGRITVVGL